MKEELERALRRILDAGQTTSAVMLRADRAGDTVLVAEMHVLINQLLASRMALELLIEDLGVQTN